MDLASKAWAARGLLFTISTSFAAVRTICSIDFCVHVHCSALPDHVHQSCTCLGHGQLTSQNVLLCGALSPVVLFTLPLTLPLAHAGLGKLISRSHLHDSITYGLRMLAARPIVLDRDLCPAPSELL